ncbi:MAG: hypothetical protein ACW99Q_25675, partial [Candidatus Kariarchaeaceae archaeon]
MSGFRDVIKGFFTTLFGIGGNPDDDFIFFWDEEEDTTEIKAEEFKIREALSNNQTEIFISTTVLLILVSLIFANSGIFVLTTIPLFVSLFLLIVTFYNFQTRYKDPLNMVNSTMNRLKELDFTDAGEFAYLKDIPESLSNLEEFRSSMSKMSERLDDTTINLMNSLFVVDEKFRDV